MKELTGSAAKALGGEEAGLGPHLLKELSNEPWYVQAIAQKLLPTLQRDRRAKLNPLGTCFTQLSTRINQEITS